MKRIIILTILVAALSSGAGAAERKYSIGTVAWIGWSPLHVADELGFWNDQGNRGPDQEFRRSGCTARGCPRRSRRPGHGYDRHPGRRVHEWETGPCVWRKTDWSHGGDKIIIKKECGHTRSYRPADRRFPGSALLSVFPGAISQDPGLGADGFSYRGNRRRGSHRPIHRRPDSGHRQLRSLDQRGPRAGQWAGRGLLRRF